MSGKNSIINTAIVESGRELRADLVSFVNAAPELCRMGAYGTIKDALLDFSRRLPDLVLCNFPISSPEEAKIVRVLREKHPRLPILILNFDDECLFGQPSGCLLKLTLPLELLNSVRAIFNGEVRSSAAVARA